MCGFCQAVALHWQQQAKVIHPKYQRENRLRESLGIFITLHKARTVYLWRLEMKQKFSQILLLEILYVLKYLGPKAQ